MSNKKFTYRGEQDFDALVEFVGEHCGVMAHNDGAVIEVPGQQNPVRIRKGDTLSKDEGGHIYKLVIT